MTLLSLLLNSSVNTHLIVLLKPILLLLYLLLLLLPLLVLSLLLLIYSNSFCIILFLFYFLFIRFIFCFYVTFSIFANIISFAFFLGYIFYITCASKVRATCIIIPYKDPSKTPIQLTGKGRYCLAFARFWMFGLGIAPQKKLSHLFNPGIRLVSVNVVMVAINI